MDRWTLQITGLGPHHSGTLGCVDEIAADFVAKLQKRGHVKVVAKLTINAYEEFVSAKPSEPPKPIAILKGPEGVQASFGDDVDQE